VWVIVRLPKTNLGRNVGRLLPGPARPRPLARPHAGVRAPSAGLQRPARLLLNGNRPQRPSGHAADNHPHPWAPLHPTPYLEACVRRALHWASRERQTWTPPPAAGPRNAVRYVCRACAAAARARAWGRKAASDGPLTHQASFTTMLAAAQRARWPVCAVAAPAVHSRRQVATVRCGLAPAAARTCWRPPPARLRVAAPHSDCAKMTAPTAQPPRRAHGPPTGGSGCGRCGCGRGLTAGKRGNSMAPLSQEPTAAR
jgi:hypothetical protein